MDRNDYYAEINSNPAAVNQSIHQPESDTNTTQTAEKAQTVQQPSYHYNPSAQPSLGNSNYHQSGSNINQHALFDLSHSGNEFYSPHISQLAAPVPQTPAAVVDNRSKQSASQLNSTSGSLYLDYVAPREESISKKHTSSVSAVAAPLAMSPPAIENASYITLNPVVSKPHDTSQSSAYSSSNYFANLESTLHFPTAKPVSHTIQNLHHPTHQSSQYSGQQYTAHKPVGQVYAEPTVAHVQEAYDMRQSTMNHDYLGMKCLSRLSPPIPASKGVTSTQYQSQQAASPTAPFQPHSPQQQNYPAFPTNLSSSSKTHPTSISLNSNQTNYTKAPNQSIPQMHHSYHQHQHRVGQQHMMNVQQRLPQQPQQQPQQPQPMMQQSQLHQHSQQHQLSYQHYGHPSMYHPSYASAADAYASCRQTQHLTLERRNEPLNHHTNSAYDFHHMHQTQPSQQTQPQSLPLSKPPALQHNKHNRSHHSQPPSLHLDPLAQDANASNRHYNFNALASAYYNTSAPSGAQPIEHHQQHHQQHNQQHSTTHSVYKAPSKDDSQTAPTMPPDQVRYQIAYGNTQPSNLYPVPHNVSQHSQSRMHRRPSVAGSSYPTAKYQHQSLPQASTIHNQDLTYLPTEAERQLATSEHHHLPMVEIYNHRPLYLNNFYNTHPNPQSQPSSLPHHQTHYPAKSSKVIYAPYQTTDHIQLQQQSSPTESHSRKSTIHDYRYPPKHYHHNNTTSGLEDTSPSYGQPPPLEHMIYNHPSSGNLYAKQPTSFDVRIPYGYPKSTKLHSNQASDSNADPKMDTKQDYVDPEEYIRTSTIHNPKFNEHQMASLAKHHPASSAAGMYDRYSLEQSYIPSYRMPSSAEYGMSKHNHHLKPTMLPMGNDCYETTRHQRLPQPSIRDYLSSWNDDEEEEPAAEKVAQSMQTALSNVIVSLQPVDDLKQTISSSLPDHRDSNGPLPDILVGIEKTKSDELNEQEEAGERLYVLESIPVPLADLSKYRHLNVINRLPDNVVNDLSPEDLAKPNTKPVETSLKFIEEVESSRAKSYKSDFESDVIYEEDVTQARSPPKSTDKESAENLKMESACSTETTVLDQAVVNEVEKDKLVTQSPEILVEVSNKKTIESMPAANSPEFKGQKKFKKSPKSNRRRSSATSSLDLTSSEQSQRCESVSYQCINADADQDISTDPTSRSISKLKIKIFRQPSSEEQTLTKIIENPLQKPSDISANHHEVHEVPTLQSLCVDTINTEDFREFLRQVNIATQLHQNNSGIAESTTLEISLDRFITEEQASEALQQSIDRFIEDDNKPTPIFFDFYSESLETRPLSDVTTLMPQNCTSFQPSSDKDYDEPEMQTVAPLSLIQEDVMQSLVEQHFSGDEAKEVVQKADLVISTSTNWSTLVETQQPEKDLLYPPMTTESNTSRSIGMAAVSPSNCSEASELSDIGLSSIDIMLKEENDSMSEMPENTTAMPFTSPLKTKQEKNSPFPSVDYNCNEKHEDETLTNKTVKESEPFPSEITKILCVPEAESIRLQSLFPEMVRTRDPEEEHTNPIHSMTLSSDDSDSSSSDDDTSSSTDDDSIDQTPMPLSPNMEYITDVKMESQALQSNKQSPITNITTPYPEIQSIEPICESTSDDEKIPSFCARPVSPDRFSKHRQSNDSQASTTPAPSELQSFSENHFSSDSSSSIVSTAIPNTLRSLSSCSSDESADDDFSTDSEEVDQERSEEVKTNIVKTEEKILPKSKCTYLSDTDSDSDCSQKDGQNDQSQIDDSIKCTDSKLVSNALNPDFEPTRNDVTNIPNEPESLFSKEKMTNQDTPQTSTVSSEEKSENSDNGQKHLTNQEPSQEDIFKNAFESEQLPTDKATNDSAKCQMLPCIQRNESVDELDENILAESNKELPEIETVHLIVMDTALDSDVNTFTELKEIPKTIVEPSTDTTDEGSATVPDCRVISPLELSNIDLSIQSTSQSVLVEDNLVDQRCIEPISKKDLVLSNISDINLDENAERSGQILINEVPKSISDEMDIAKDQTSSNNFYNSKKDITIENTFPNTTDSTESQETLILQCGNMLTESGSIVDETQLVLKDTETYSKLKINQNTEEKTIIPDDLPLVQNSKPTFHTEELPYESTEINSPKPTSSATKEHCMQQDETGEKEICPTKDTAISAPDTKDPTIEGSIDEFETLSINIEDMLDKAFNDAASITAKCKATEEEYRAEFETESVNSEDMLENAFNEATTSLHPNNILSDENSQIRSMQEGNFNNEKFLNQRLKNFRESRYYKTKSVTRDLNSLIETEDLDKISDEVIQTNITSKTVIISEKSIEDVPKQMINEESEKVSRNEIETDSVDSESMLESAFNEAAILNQKLKPNEVNSKFVPETEISICKLSLDNEANDFKNTSDLGTASVVSIVPKKSMHQFRPHFDSEIKTILRENQNMEPTSLPQPIDHNTNCLESDSESTLSMSTSPSSSSSSSHRYSRNSLRNSPQPFSSPQRSPLRPSPALFDLDSEFTPIESHLTNYHAFDSFELDAYCEPYRNIDNPLSEGNQSREIDPEHDSNAFDVTTCVKQIWEDVENLMDRLKCANRARRKLSPIGSLETGEPVEKRGRFIIKPIIDISELTVCPINAEILREESVDTIDSEVANLLGEPESDCDTQSGKELVVVNQSKTTDSLIDDLTLDDTVLLEDTPEYTVPSHQLPNDQILLDEQLAIFVVPRLSDLCADIVQNFCVFIGEESNDELSESDVPQQIMLEMEAMFMPEEEDSHSVADFDESPEVVDSIEKKSTIMDINQEILLEIQSILEPTVVQPTPVAVEEVELVVFEDHESYIQYEEVVPQNLPKFQLKALRQRLYNKYRTPSDRSCSKQIRRKYGELRRKWIKAKKPKCPLPITPAEPIKTKLVPVVFKPLPGPRISRTKSCDAPRSYSTSSSSSSTSSSIVAPRTTRSTVKARPALNHCKSLMEPLAKRSKPNFDEILLGINQFYAKPCVNNNNNNNNTTNNSTDLRTTNSPIINTISPTTPPPFSTDKVKRLIIPRSKIFDANMIAQKPRVPPKTSQQKPVVRLIRSPLIDRLCKLSAISSYKMNNIKQTPKVKLQTGRTDEILQTPTRRLRTKSMFASR